MKRDERIVELREAIAVNEQHLDDCKNDRSTEYLRTLHAEWDGGDELDFAYLANVVSYSLEEDRDNLWKLTRCESNVPTTKWTAMIVELVNMIGAADENTTPDVFIWASEQLVRIGEHLDSLPADHKLPMVPTAEYQQARRDLLSAA